MVTEGAYGQLKGCWWVLLRKCDSHPDEVKIVTLSCMVLHIICISQGDLMPKTLDISIDPETLRRRDSSKIRNILHITESKESMTMNLELVKSVTYWHIVYGRRKKQLTIRGNR